METKTHSRGKDRRNKFAKARNDSGKRWWRRRWSNGLKRPFWEREMISEWQAEECSAASRDLARQIKTHSDLGDTCECCYLSVARRRLKLLLTRCRRDFFQQRDLFDHYRIRRTLEFSPFIFSYELPFLINPSAQTRIPPSHNASDFAENRVWKSCAQI